MKTASTTISMKNNSEKLPTLIADDPWLEPYLHEVNQRISFFTDKLAYIKKTHNDLLTFANWHNEMGFQYDSKAKGWWYREWAPEADQLSLIGDFNHWDDQKHPLQKSTDGIWSVFIPDADGLAHETLVKVRITAKGITRDRIPAFIRRAVQNEVSYDFAGQLWNPSTPFAWTDASFDLSTIRQPLIYECHIGMAQEKEGVGTFREFADQVLPRIHALGYNCIQCMAIAEHPYYGSFGYHVANYFAPSSRFGTPEDLKYLINKAHTLGIAVIMDLVHSHAVKNIAEGLADFDGSGNQYFHQGSRGYHSGWDSMLFDYGKEEVQRFLLSNIRYWLEEFHFDGFRFDGVTSILYHHHGDFMSFDHYDKYFKEGVDWDAILYLQLANETIKNVKPHALSIAEDMSGMPGTCRKPMEGGIGFDYRLGMGIPDYWIKLLKHKADEEWSMNELWNVLSNRRWKEKTVAYAESHDQAMVGDKTIAFWLMDKEMYWHMRKEDQNLIIDRGIALHKMIRCISAVAGGEAYMNFIGNEFGHPEWIDFPREGNNWSYQYARRQWGLVDNPELKFEYLNEFDKAMLRLIDKYQVLNALPAKLMHLDEHNKTIIFERANLLFIFSFHPTSAIFDYRFHLENEGGYHTVLCSDDVQFGGFGRIDSKVQYRSAAYEHGHQLSIYNTNRTVLVLEQG